MTEGEHPDIQPADYKTLAAREIWIKPANQGRLARASAGFRWNPEERRLLWITSVGGAVGSLVVLLIVGLAVGIDRWKPSGGKAGTVRAQDIEQLVTLIIVAGLLGALAFRGWRKRQPFDRTFDLWKRIMWLAAVALILLALVGRAAGIH